MTKTVKSYGSWASDLTPEAIAAGARRFGDVLGAGPYIYWSEGRPAEKGRQVIMRAGLDSAGHVTEPAHDLLPAAYSARSRVHEYGGGEFLVSEKRVFFVNDKDQDVYELMVDAQGNGTCRKLTNEPAIRFGGAIHDAARNCLIAVAEREVAGAQPENLLVSIALPEADAAGAVVAGADASSGNLAALVTGHDFFASPVLSSGGKRLAWIAWDLPDMPWDQAALYIAEFNDDGSLGEARHIAGGNGTAIFQPRWLDGRLQGGHQGAKGNGDEAGAQLVYVSDETGWGNLYVWDGDASRCVLAREAEFGRPLWQLGITAYAVRREGARDVITASYFEDGNFRFADIDVATGAVSSRELPFPLVDDICGYDSGVAGIAGRHEAPSAIVAISHDKTAAPAILREAAEGELDPAGVSRGELLSFPGGDGGTVYGLYYPPMNARFTGPADERPPAIITVHGGPTTYASRGLNLRTQYYTSRGFAVFDVDYAGSTNYGRAYRERLDGKWGISDVADCEAAAAHLVAAGLADKTRIAIKGGSAGGYTVLMALATSEVFAAGCCHYGISDLQLLYEHTHKFESGYLHRLLGTTAEDHEAIFKARSPLALIDGISSPVILFQGLDDEVVPPEQSQIIVEKLRAKGLTVAYHEYAGEGHGFRQAQTIVSVLTEELKFLQDVMGLGTAG